MTPARRGRTGLAVAAALVAAATVGATVAGERAHPAALSPAAAPALGVLQADTRWLASDTAAGVTVAVLNVSWRQWEPSPGAFDAGYRAEVLADVMAYRGRGWAVTVDPGLQDPPDWVLGLPGGRLVDQRGAVSMTADFEFSQPVRQAAAAFLRDLVAATTPAVSGFRVGLSESGEVLYPATTSDQWWAYSLAAQHGGAVLPPGVAPTPLPGWVPGRTRYGAKPVSAVQVRAWYRWYLSAMVGAHAWEISTYRAAGFAGRLDLVIPGTGTVPSVYSQRLGRLLAPIDTDPVWTMNTGAVWWSVLDELPDLRGVAMDISSVYDTSGTPRGNACQPSDASVDYRHDPAIEQWSDTRWLAYLARRHGMSVTGENGGDSAPADAAGVIALARACGLQVIQWAWDYQLHGVGSTRSHPLASLEDVDAALRRS